MKTESEAPAVGALVVDTKHGERTGEFRGLAGRCWLLRPVGGGPEWKAEPDGLRKPTPAERLGAMNALQNARSRRAVL